MPGRDALPDATEVVVVGGGVVGLSAAYHLARAGVDVVLLERDALGSGSTCRAAGGVRAQFSDEVNIRLGLRSLEAFERFGHDLGHEIDLAQVGYLFLLDRPEDVADFTRHVALQNSLGVDSRLLDAAEAARLAPYAGMGGVLAAAWSPRDGHCTPEAVVAGYAAGARRAGAVVRAGCAVTDIERAGDRLVAVDTPEGRLRAGVVVCAAGAWSREVAGWAGVDLPVEPLRRQVLLTEPVAGLPAHVPFTIDFSTGFYLHREGPGLLMGMADPEETPGFRLERSDRWLPALAEVVARRAPGVAEVGVRGGWAGLYEMTPDHNALIGEAPDLQRFVYATGFSGHGFLMGPAVGEVVRDLVLGVAPVVDVSGLDAQRFARQESRPERHVV